MCENKPVQEAHTMQTNAIILMTPASLKSYSFKDYQRHDNLLGFNQEYILKNVFKRCIYIHMMRLVEELKKLLKIFIGLMLFLRIYILFWPKISAKTTEILTRDTSKMHKKHSETPINQHFLWGDPIWFRFVHSSVCTCVHPSVQKFS